MFHDLKTAMDPYVVHVAQIQQFLPGGGNFGFYYNKSPRYIMNLDAAYNYSYNNWCLSNNYGHVHQLVDLRNKENMFRVTEKDLTTEISSMSANASYVKTDSRDEHRFGASKAKIPFHIASILKPQLKYGIVVNNANQPFYHALLKMSEDGSRFIHPLEKYSFFHFVDKSVSNIKPVRPSPVENTTFTFVQDTKGLMGLAAKLRIVNEFTDPTKRKVMHGADKGIIWLQRDFSIYVCNMFDTWQASRVLKMERNSLEHLLLEDTHYLLHIYDLMKRRLLSSSTDPDWPESLLVEVYKRSYDVCMQLYEKKCKDANSYLNIYGLHAADLNGQQLAVVFALFQWRDLVARGNDESTGYVLPNKTLIEIAKTMPSTIEELFRVLKNRYPLIDHHLGAITNIIQKSKANAKAFEEVAARLKRKRLEMH
nr:protein RRP6-like 2 [Tanacetum cinerariifolium]